jgi:hypothetical protein
MPNVEFCKEPAKFFALFTDPAIAVQSVNFISDEVLAVTYLTENAYVDALPNTNPVIASFVTAYARLRLYEVMAKLGRRCLYSDTDSGKRTF